MYIVVVIEIRKLFSLGWSCVSTYWTLIIEDISCSQCNLIASILNGNSCNMTI